MPTEAILMIAALCIVALYFRWKLKDLRHGK